MGVLGVLCAPVARAGVTCRVIATMCPPEPSRDWDRDDHDPKPVPEPGTLALLAAGAGAVRAALRRRRNKVLEAFGQLIVLLATSDAALRVPTLVYAVTVKYQVPAVSP
jgi:hypothetical protein